MEPFSESRLDDLYDTLLFHVRNADGKWVWWQQLRPAFRVRETYEGPLWDLVQEDPEIETEETPWGGRTRRRVRLILE